MLGPQRASDCERTMKYLPGKSEEKNIEARMTFTEHLGELRDRLIKSGLVLIAAFVVSYMFSDWIFDVLKNTIEKSAQTVEQTEPVESGSGVPEVEVPLDKLIPVALIVSTEIYKAAQESGGDSVPVIVVRIDNIQETGIVLSGGPLTVPAVQADKSKGFPWLILNPLEPVFVKLKLAAYGALVLALPFLLFQGSSFIFPAMSVTERRAARLLLFGCVILGVTGVCVAYKLIFPTVLPYLMDRFVPEGVEIQLRMNETITIIVKGLMAFGIAFQFPMLVLTLVYLGLLTPKTLREYRKIAIVGLAVVSAMFTPPDPITMMIMLVPLWLLYELSIVLSYLVIRGKEKRRAEG